MEEKKKLLYEQLYDQVMEWFRDKPYYSLLPSERELCSIFHVSRPTVRKAMEMLERDRCIVRVQGKGAFFIGIKKNQNDEKAATKQIAFYNRVFLRGDYTSSKVLTQKVVLANEEMAKKLGVAVGEKLFRLERLRYINEELWSLADSYSKHSLCPKLMEYDYSERSLHNTMASYGQIPHHAHRHITIHKATEYEAMQLGLQPGDGVCVYETYTYNQYDELLEYSVGRTDVWKVSFDFDMTNLNGSTVESAESRMP